MKKILMTTVATGLVVGGFYAVSSTKDTCVNLYVDYGSVNNKAKVTQCVPVSNKTNALDILDKAKLNIEGTRKYGNAVVCRVNGLPDKSVESCEIMPPENAYWAVIIKKKQVIPFPSNEWGWAQKGINETFLSPGDNLGLVFSTNGEVRWP
jgi:hypothetical protein